MMALYMPTQPSSKTPRMALRVLRPWASNAPNSRSALGRTDKSSSCTWLKSCSIACPLSHCRRPLRKNSSLKSLLHRVLKVTPPLCRQPFRSELVHMAQILFDRLSLKPLPQTIAEELVLEIFAPQGAEGDSALMQAAIPIGARAHGSNPVRSPVP